MEVKGFSELHPEVIVWEDITQNPETWPSGADIRDWLADAADAFVEQVGYVLYEDDKILVIADSYIESLEVYGNVHKIPKSVIRERRALQALRSEDSA